MGQRRRVNPRRIEVLLTRSESIKAFCLFPGMELMTLIPLLADV